eukprot:3180814-Rhodomonas_salina.1
MTSPNADHASSASMPNLARRGCHVALASELTVSPTLGLTCTCGDQISKPKKTEITEKLRMEINKVALSAGPHNTRRLAAFHAMRLRVLWNAACGMRDPCPARAAS